MKYYLPFLLLAVASITSCKKQPAKPADATPAGYSQYYAVNFYKSENKTEAHAIFTTATANMLLPQGYSIAANGKNYDSITAQNPTYVWNMGGLPDDVKFEFTRPDGKVLTNTAHKTDIHPVDFAAPLPDTVSRKQGFSFKWTGGDDLGETSYVAIGAPSPNAIIRSFNGNTAIIDSSDLRNIPKGFLGVMVFSAKEIALTEKDGAATANLSLRSVVQDTLWLKD